MKILLIGANSYLGARLFYDFGKQYFVVGTYSSHQLSKKFIQLDITQKDSVKKIINETKPDIIIHVANNPSVEWCKANPEKAIALNQTATKHTIDSANKNKSKIIYFSSMGAIDPKNLYSTTKLESEKIIKTCRAGYLILRPSLILGFSPNTTNDRPFNRFLRNLDSGEPAIYDSSWKFQPTYIGHITDVINECIGRDIWNETITIATPELKSRFDTAYDILTPFGVTVTPVDKQDTKFSNFADELGDLKRLHLPQYSYSEMVEKIVHEIKNRKKFRIE